jgi:hypothetical protein
VSNAGTITILANKGTIGGGVGKFSGSGGAGASNSGTITTLTNSGTIGGGNGGTAGGPGGAGVSNGSTILALVNSGLIEGGKGGTGGAAGDAIFSAGAHASIGSITNTGHVVGSVVIDNQASVTVTGATGTTFGSWTKGAITIGNGNLTFASGNTFLGDNVEVDGGAGTVTNKNKLLIPKPLTITGNFTQTASGVLGFDFAGDLSGQYGALTTTKLTTLDGRLAIELTNGFTLATNDRFDILAFGSRIGKFDALSLDGAACSSAGTDKWACGSVGLNEVIKATSLDLVVAHAAAVRGLSSSPIPEPSTWAMLGLGFLGLGGLRLMGRRKPAPS